MNIFTALKYCCILHGRVCVIVSFTQPLNDVRATSEDIFGGWNISNCQDRTKWRCLINKGASQFEEKRICEAERKRKERKGRAKEPSSVSAQSEFTCSICNRQFRAKIGLYSHQRTHKHT